MVVVGREDHNLVGLRSALDHGQDVLAIKEAVHKATLQRDRDVVGLRDEGAVGGCCKPSVVGSRAKGCNRGGGALRDPRCKLELVLGGVGELDLLLAGSAVEDGEGVSSHFVRVDQKHCTGLVATGFFVLVHPAAIVRQGLCLEQRGLGGGGGRVVDKHDQHFVCDVDVLVVVPVVIWCVDAKAHKDKTIDVEVDKRLGGVCLEHKVGAELEGKRDKRSAIRNDKTAGVDCLRSKQWHILEP
mmetsp:Transcript_17508/g.29019  ORF Transcript_17508/g.29019 Transcript_17508/m.29019 type:complete len:242 (+) Transcript_17508:643-1368(+)